MRDGPPVVGRGVGIGVESLVVHRVGIELPDEIVELPVDVRDDVLQRLRVRD